jgi:PDZ domain/C2 domain
VSHIRSSVLAALIVGGCAYPRRSTALSPVSEANDLASQPADVWQLTVVDAQVPPMARGAIEWDGPGDAPDPFLRIYRDDVLVWQSDVLDNTREPVWNVTLPENVYLPQSANIRLELWDDDGMSADPIGTYRNRGLPGNVVPDSDGRVLFEGGAQATLRLGMPKAHRGLGIRLYEVRGDALAVVEVETYSPAGRAGVQPGDAIIAIGGQTVAQLGDQRAPGALSMASERQQRLRLRAPNGQTRDVELDRGLTWLSM